MSQEGRGSTPGSHARVTSRSYQGHTSTRVTRSGHTATLFILSSLPAALLQAVTPVCLPAVLPALLQAVRALEKDVARAVGLASIVTSPAAHAAELTYRWGPQLCRSRTRGWQVTWGNSV
jgi:hypothetical protein